MAGTWKDGSGVRRNGRRPNGWPNDSKCPDGFTCNGFRKISKAGRIRFAGTFWTHESYAAGSVVYVSLDDPYGAQINTVALDSKWTPDNIADDYRGFFASLNDPIKAVRPQGVGDWNARKCR